MLASFSLALCLAAPAFQDGDKPVEKGDRTKGRSAERVTLPREKKQSLFMDCGIVNADPATPFLVLCHQARSARAEYRPMEPHLRELGYNWLAIDLSSGAECRDIKNQTAKMALDIGKNPTYLDALPDIFDAVIWAKKNHSEGKLLVWGSSYSASLALVLAAEHPDLIDGVIAFSPGEYFAALGKSATWVREEAARIDCPIFVTGAKTEESDWRPLFDAVPAKVKTGFVPESAGVHGSRALWPDSAGNEEYWKALDAFLKTNFPAPAPKGGDDVPVKSDPAPKKDH